MEDCIDCKRMLLEIEKENITGRCFDCCEESYLSNKQVCQQHHCSYYDKCNAKMEHVFVISPVRNITEDHHSEIIEELDKKFHVHWPIRDTKQDATEMEICEENRKAIIHASKVFIIWSEDIVSTGTLFDVGMAFQTRKNIIPICLPRATTEKSFQNMIVDYHVHKEQEGKISVPLRTIFINDLKL